MYRIALIVFTIVAALWVPATAQENAEDDFSVVLRSIDVIPDRDALTQRWPDAADRLRAAAVDTSLTSYERRRAVTLLSMFPTDETRRFLADRAIEADDAQIRAMSVYTLGRTFGADGDADLVKAIRASTRDDASEVRQWAVRALRWVAHPDAHRLLTEIASGSDASLPEIARRALEKRRFASDPETPTTR